MPPFRHEVVILGFGASPHLDACIDSIKRQERKPDLIRISTSTPNRHILGTADRHGVAVVENPRVGGGIAADWNFALGIAQSELVTLAHQDDVYEPSYSKSMVSAMTRHPSSMIGFCDFVEVNPAGESSDSLNNKVKRLLTRRAFGAKEEIGDTTRKRKLLCFGNPICCPSVIFNRSQLGQFEFTGTFKSNLDWEAWLRLSSRAGSFVYVRDVLVKRRNHPLTTTAALIQSRDRLREDRALFQHLWPTPVAELLTQFYKLGYIGNDR